jgi:exportin-2 (importin alpha re-exporter)
LQALLAKAPEEVVRTGQLEAMLGVFQKLNSSKAHDHEGFALLNSIFASLPLEAYNRFMPTVWNLLFQRMQVQCLNSACKGIIW